MHVERSKERDGSKPRSGRKERATGEALVLYINSIRMSVCLSVCLFVCLSASHFPQREREMVRTCGFRQKLRNSLESAEKL